LHNVAQELSDAYFDHMSVFRDGGLEAVLSPDLRRNLGDYSPRRSMQELFQAFRHLPPMEQMQAVDLQTYLPGDILVKVDRTTMAYSLESRAPWLDHRLAELACRLPAGFKLHGGAGKHVFKQAVAPFLPPALLTRSKMGFTVPLAAWFRSSLTTVFPSTVLHKDMEQYISLGEVRRLWSEHQSGLRDHGQKLWNLLMLALWHGRYRSPRPVAAEVAACG